MTMPFYVPPEQLVKDRAEFARKGIARGRSIVALAYNDGLLMLAENPSRTLHKISEVYDRIAFCGVGRFNEFELLRVAGIRHADLKGYLYGRSDVLGKSLANSFAQTLGNIFTHEVKPYEVELLVAELGSDTNDDRFYKILYDGTLYDDRRFAAIGGHSEQLTERLEAAWSDTMDLAAAIVTGAASFGDDRPDPDDWEAAVLERNGRRRSFRRLTPDEIAEILAAG